jgi:hypothetical protein
VKDFPDFVIFIWGGNAVNMQRKSVTCSKNAADSEKWIFDAVFF